jgi:hypothetical protein
MTNNVQEGYNALQQAAQELAENRDYVTKDAMNRFLGRINRQEIVFSRIAAEIDHNYFRLQEEYQKLAGEASIRRFSSTFNLGAGASARKFKHNAEDLLTDIQVTY